MSYNSENLVNKILPPEIWFKVLDKINDPQELIKSRGVCSAFKEIIEKLIIKKKVWKKLLTNDIELWKSQIVAKLYPNVRKEVKWRSLFQVVYKKIIISYNRWNSLSGIQYSPVETFDIKKSLMDNEEITCTAVWANYIAVGTNLGSVFFYKLDNLKKHFFVADHFEYVTQATFWYLGKNKLVAVTTSVNNNLKFWNVSDKIEIQTPFKYQGKFLCVGLNHRLFAEDSSKIIEYTLKSSGKITLTSKFTHDGTFNDPNELEFGALYSENDKIQILKRNTYESRIICKTFVIPKSHKSNVKRLQSQSFGFCNLEGYEFTRYTNCLYHIATKNISVFSYGVSKLGSIVKQIYLTINVSDVNDRSVNKCETIRILLRQGVTITSLVMHVGLLFLGLSTGKIFIYEVKIEQALSMEINIRKVSSLQLPSDHPIVSLNLTEHERTQYIIASTKSDLYSVSITQN